jgi:CubicO group peptidase (beta-lactamase class C family)
LSASPDERARFDDGLPRARPSAHGVDAARLEAFLHDAQRLGVELQSFMLWHRGAVLAEGWWWPYAPQRPRMMHSATKSFLSAGIGLAIEEGRFALGDRVMSFFPEHAPKDASDFARRMTVEDLLTQTSGHAQGASGSIWRAIRTSWIAEFFKIPVVFEPGTHFRYTSATSFLLSAILTRTTGLTAHDYLKPRLFDPLGIEGLAWDLGPGNINPGGNGISAKTSDLLKLAVLHLQGGEWNGRQLLPRGWVMQATSPQRGNAHGRHWWMGPGGAFYAYGVFGQFAVVSREADAVLAVTAAVPNGEETLRSLLWHHFPRMAEGGGGSAAADAALESRTVALRLSPRAERTDSPLAPLVSGRSYTAEPNEDGIRSLRVTITPARCVLHLDDAKGLHEVAMGWDEWIEGDTSISGAALHHGYEPDRMRVVAGARWRDAQTLEMTWQFVETAFRDTAALRFAHDGSFLTFERSVNVNSRELKRPPCRARYMPDTFDTRA